MKIIAFGEVIWDIYPDEALLGGAPLNFCAHLACLGDSPYLLSAVSVDDEYGKRTLSAIQKYKIGDCLMQKNMHPTGRCNVTLDENKVPTYKIATGSAHDSVTLSDKDLSELRTIGADVFYFNTLIQRDKTARETLGKILANCSFRDIFCDINLRENCYDRESLLVCLKNATYFKLSDGEVKTLVELNLLPKTENITDSAEVLCKTYTNIRYAILTLGKDGSAVYDRDAGKLYESGKPENVPVVSTVGAGDCYGATFLHGIYHGMTVPEAIKLATDRSNIVVSHKEAIPF